MNQRLYPLLLLITCLSIPSGAAAQYSLTKISGDGQTGRTGQAFEPFVVEVRQNGNPVSAGVIVTFLPDNDNIPWRLSHALPQTNENGVAQTTLTLLGAGTMTITALAGTASTTFTATAIRRGTTTSTSTPSPPSVPEPDPTVFFRVSGDNQRGVVSELLAKPLVVGTRDRGGDPLEGLRIVFKVVTGGGTLSAAIAWTDATGRAANTLTLGPKPGANTVEVRAHGTERVVVFRAEATLPPTPTALSIISGDNQSGVTGEALAAPFVVEVRDQYSNPMGGVTVTFAVTAGDGALSATAATTDTNGRAASTLTPGSNPGTNTVSASVEGISQTVAFTAEATLPPPTPTTLSTVPDQTGASPIDVVAVEVHDQNGDPLGDVAVTFAIRGEDGSQHTTTVPTDENGGAAFTVPPETDPGRYTVTGSVEGIAETVTFTIAVPFEFELLLSAGINLIHIPLKVSEVDGMPGAIGSVSDLYDLLGGVAAVNFLITYDADSQEWRAYFGEADRGGIGDAVLTDHTGIIVSAVAPISVRLSGDALGMDGTATVPLHQGLNLVGLPLRDPRLVRVSDLFAVEGVADNVDIIVVTADGTFRSVSRAGDAGDIEITGGQGFLLFAGDTATVPISGDAWGD